MAERKRKQGRRVEGKAVNEMAEPGNIPKGELAGIIGKRLAAARKGAKAENGAALTQSLLAKKMGCVPAYVSMAELGQRLPSVEMLVSWAGACGVEVSEFFTGLEAEAEALR